ncbi:MAG TPA: hypothetical protein VFC68_06055, partial [Treponemataceae bacterium]|nr:hypothetical protein [Treponemataceae bacterium]
STICEFADCFVFFDSEPALVCIHKENFEVKRIASPVFPGAKAISNGKDLIVQGRDGQEYVFVFGNDIAQLDVLENFGFMYYEQTLAYYKNKIEPDKKSKEAILDGVSNWAGSPHGKELPQMKFVHANNIEHIYAINNDIFENKTIPSLFVFSPIKQGIYKIGICNENKKWLQIPAFVAVFNDGELSIVSLDYKSDEPQVQLQLSNQKLYYIVAGKFADHVLDTNEDMSDLFLKIEAVK